MIPATALILWYDDPLVGQARPHHFRGFTITPRHTHTHTHMVGLLWTSDRTVAVYLTTHNTHIRQDSNL